MFRLDVRCDYECGMRMRIRVRADMSARIPSASASASMSFCVGPRAPTNPIVWPRSLFINNKIRLVATSLAHPHWQQQQQQAICLPIPPPHIHSHIHIVALALAPAVILQVGLLLLWLLRNASLTASDSAPIPPEHIGMCRRRLPRHSTDQSATIQRMNESRAEQAGRLRSREQAGRRELHWLRHFRANRLVSNPSPLAAGKIDVIQLAKWTRQRGSEAASNSRRQSLKIGYKRPHNQSQNQRKFLTVIVFLVLYSNFFPYDHHESGPDVDDDGDGDGDGEYICEICREMEDGVAEMPRNAEQRQPMMLLS